MAQAVIAGCGFVGTALGEMLAADGHQVWGIRRDPSRLPPSITPLALDLRAPLTSDELPPAPDWVVFAAAPSSHGQEDYKSTYVEGVRHLLEYAERAKATRLIFISSTAVYGQADGEWVDESSATEPSSHGGANMLLAEELVGAADLATCAFRCAGIYGPGRTRLIDSVRDGSAALGGPVDPYTNRIHRHDVAAAVLFLLNSPRLPPRLIGSDDEPAKRSDVLGWLAATMGLSVPQGPARTSRRGGNKRCSNRALKELGYRFSYPSFRSGYLPMMQALGYAGPPAGQAGR